MLIIAGHLVVDPTERDAYVAECVTVVAAARRAPGCLDFSITADSVDPARIRVFERWADEAQSLIVRISGTPLRPASAAGSEGIIRATTDRRHRRRRSPGRDVRSTGRRVIRRSPGQAEALVGFSAS